MEADSIEARRLPLAGIRVVDFSIIAAGPLTTKLLADYGAEVILVESQIQITRSGGSRQNGPPGMSPINTSWFHNKFSTNKLSITLDLSREEARAVLYNLISVSDIFVANRRREVLERLGLDYPTLRSYRPDLIYLNMPMMGSNGPREFYGGVSWGIQAMAGLNMLSGFPDRAPVSPSPWSHPDVSANPLFAHVAVLSALHHRQQTGQGQEIELSQYESTICWTGPALLETSANGVVPRRAGNWSAAAAPHDVYRCAQDDTWCAISIANDEQWTALCSAIGCQDVARDARFGTHLQRQQHAHELRDIIETWTTRYSAEAVMRDLQAAGVPCARLNDLAQLLRDDPQLAERRLWQEVEHPELETSLVEGWGMRLRDTAPEPARRAPLLGEHNEYVFREILKMPQEVVDQYYVDGVFE